MTQQAQVADGSLRRPWLGTQVYRWQAIQVANILRRHKNVQDVLVFGSLARGVVGDDIDLIVIADPEFAYDWLHAAKAYMEDFEREQAVYARSALRLRNGVYHHKNLRQEAAIDALGPDFGNLWRRTWPLVRQDRLDLFVFPPDWREQLEKLQRALPHTDPMFMQNIARDAVRI